LRWFSVIRRICIGSLKSAIIEDISQPAFQSSTLPKTTENLPIQTIYENERDHVLRILKKCNGRVWGVGGAAEVLGVPPTTLKSKMKKLNIAKDEY